ncbi:SpoIIE family protein phosphatase [Streptomyces sp. NPDC020965]|uniref:SpoIIE family protein phosphatase n=1 Tax=Streptomyces sp. NPDC020965 TaxID=3365105 RepID=UPI00378967FD
MESSQGTTIGDEAGIAALDDALRSAPHPVIIADAAGTITSLNRAAAALLTRATIGAGLRATAPTWLARAHRELAGAPAPARSVSAGAPHRPVHGRVGAQTFEARPTRRHDGSVVWWLTDDTDRHLAEEALSAERERTRFLAEASNVLLASLNTDRCMVATARLAAEHFGDAAVVIAPAVGRGLPVAHAVRGGEAIRTTLTADPASVPGLGEALQGFPPVPSRWIDPGSLPAWLLPPGFDGAVGSVMVSPLPGHGVAAGALVLLRGAEHTAFSESEEIFTGLFAARAGAALSAARLYAEQSSITRTLMRELLPPAMRQVQGVEFAGGYRPAGQTERVGGDFYDIHPAETPDEESLIVLGDVCGKGLEAAVLTGKIRNTLQALLPMADDHERMLGLLNGALINSHHTRFATLVMASVSREGQLVRLRLTSAGHPPPLIVRRNGDVEVVATQGTLVGAIPAIHAHTVATTLRPGETCLLYTDGITEARGGPLGDALFGQERLEQALADCVGMPAEAVVEHIQMLATEWLGRNSADDMAVLAITAPHTAHLSAVDGHTQGRYTA